MIDVKNPDLDQAISQFLNDEMDFEEFSNYLALECAMDSFLMAPVVFRNGFTQADADNMLENPDEECEIDVEFRMVDDNKGNTWFTAFTDGEQLPEGDDTGLIAVSFEEVVQMAYEDEDLMGLAINPFNVGLFIPKDDLQLVIKKLDTAKGEVLVNCGAEAYMKGDYEEAIELYEEAVGYGCVKAMSNLGYCHYYGRSVPVNYEKARLCWEKAAAMGDACAVYKLADMYRKGDLPMDVEWARMMYKKAFALAAENEDDEVFADVALRILKYCRDDIDDVIALNLAEDMVKAYEQRIEEGDHFAVKLCKEATAIRDSIRRQADVEVG